MTNIAPHSSQTQDTDLHRYLQIVWRRKWILLLCVTVIPVSAYFFSARADKEYEASATLQVEPTGTQPVIETGATARSLASTVSLAQTITVAQAAAERLENPPSDPRDLRGAVELGTDPTAGFVTVKATAGSGQRAADIANAYADAIRATRTARARAQIDRTIRGTGSTRRTTRRGATPTAAEEALQQQVEQLRIARADQTNKTQVIEPALPPGSAASPKPLKTASLALVIALMIGIGLIVLLNALDRRVTEPEELEDLLERPLLGVVPVSALPGQQPLGYVHESFHMLRATLTYFNVEPLETVMIVSPVSGDGKTTVATNLAIAVARSGKSVFLLDTDLRHPQADARLLGHHTPEGLGSYLAGEHSLDEVVQEVDIDGVEFEFLPAGLHPPNPSELLASERMRSLLTELRGRVDMVIIDTAPLLAVSDAIPLLSQVSGVVAVSRLRQTPRKSVVQMAGIIASARGNLLGAVATGAPDGSGYGYGYGYYGHQPEKKLPKVKTKQSPNGQAAGPVDLALPSARTPEDAAPEQDS